MLIDSPAPSNSLQTNQALSLNGAHRALQAYTSETEKISRGELEPKPMIEANQQSTLYSMNLKLVSVADEMTGNVLNLIA